MANGITKNPSFHTDFKNVNLILVKSAPKKVFAKKLFCHLKYWLSPKKSVILGKTFLGALFIKGTVAPV
jgi:hypothetical protein